MSLKPTHDQEHKAAHALTRVPAPAPIGGLQAVLAAAEADAAIDHDKVVAATAKISSFRPSDAFSDAEAITETRVVTKYSTLENVANAVAAAARATIAALQNAARANAATPQLTRK